MRGPAGIWVALFLSAVAAAAQAAAADRFVPADPDFVVANVQAALPDPQLRELIARWRQHSTDEAAGVALAEAFLERAQRLREPMYIGRAEAVLAQAARRPAASSTAQRLYAQTLQYRHDFSAAEGVLGRRTARRAPRCGGARTARLAAAGARRFRRRACRLRAACCAAPPSQAIALACLAQVQASSDRLAQAQSLLAAWPAPPAHDGAIRAYWLTVRGELHERANQLDRAIADYGAALTLQPANDAIRATLADALVARGEPHEARELLDVERPGLALLVRRAACAQGAERATLRAQAAAWLELEACARRFASISARRRCWPSMAVMRRRHCARRGQIFSSRKNSSTCGCWRAPRWRPATPMPAGNSLSGCAAPDFAMPSRKRYSPARRAVRVAS